MGNLVLLGVRFDKLFEQARGMFVKIEVTGSWWEWEMYKSEKND